MKIVVKGKNIDVTDALREYVEKRFEKLEKYFHKEMEGTVTLSVVKNDQTAEATLPINRYILRAEDTSGDLYGSIDAIVEKLERQIRKYKTRVNRKSRQVHKNDIPVFISPEPAPEESQDQDQAQADDDIRISKTKTFKMKPMDPEEAIMQMELIDHDFFVFLNADDHETSVVYRRKDGGYGLILTEIK